MTDRSDSEAPSVRLAHFSDTHLGYEAYRALGANGNNQRSVDIVRAFIAACKAIIDDDPPLVIHTGDVAERPHVSNNILIIIRQWFSKVAGIRPDGTRRQLVVIAGNHELPSSRREACFLELYRDLPGVHVVTDDYRIVTFDDAGADGGASSDLESVAVHCVPHDTLKDLAVEQRFDEVQPLPGQVNILAAHGVAGGSGLFKRTMGREYEIPTDVLVRRWDYGALGHWHRQGPVALVGTGGGKNASSGRVWYAGSTENCGFGDLLDNGTGRGYLRVSTNGSQMPDVERVSLPIRTMYRLPVLEGAGMTPEQIADELRTRIKDSAGRSELHGAIVGQIVKGVPREIWALVDVQGVRDTARDALHYEITVEPVATPEAGGDEPAREGLGDIARVLEERAQAILARADQQGAIQLSRTLLNRHLAEPVSDDTDADAPAGDMKGGADEPDGGDRDLAAVGADGKA